MNKENSLLLNKKVFIGVNTQEHKSIDFIRQSFIDLNENSKEESVIDLLNSLIQHLEKNITYDEANELIALILKCFMCLSNVPLSNLNDLYEKSKKNSYTIITFSSVLSYLINSKPNFDHSIYKSFITESLQEILPQLQNQDKLILFGQQIPFQFRIDLILDLLLSSELTDQIIKDFLPQLNSIKYINENNKYLELKSKIKKSELSPLIESLHIEHDNQDQPTDKKSDKITPYTKPIDDEIISAFISDPNPEFNEELKKKLFAKMLSERSNLVGYLQTIFENIPYLAIAPEKLLAYYNEEYSLHKDEFVEILHNVFVLHPTQKVFVIKPKIDKPFKISESPFNTKIISTLFEIVSQDPSNFQAYYCLEYIASSFPFIFNFKQVIDVVLPAFDNYKENFYDQTKEEEQEKQKMNKVKAAITSLSFLIFVLNSPKNMDEFVDYFFNNYKQLSLSQILCFFIVFSAIFHTNLDNYLSISFCKHKSNENDQFIQICNEIIDTGEIPENLFGLNFNYYMYNVLNSYSKTLLSAIPLPSFYYFVQKDNIFTDMSENHITHLDAFLSSINDYVLYDNKNEKKLLSTTNDDLNSLIGNEIPSWTMQSRKDDQHISTEQVNSFLNHYNEKYNEKLEVSVKDFPNTDGMINKCVHRVGSLLIQDHWVRQFIIGDMRFPILQDHFKTMQEIVCNFKGNDDEIRLFLTNTCKVFRDNLHNFAIKMFNNILTKFCRPTNQFAKIFALFSNKSINYRYIFLIIEKYPNVIGQIHHDFEQLSSITINYTSIFSTIKNYFTTIDQTCPYFAKSTSHKIEDILCFLVEFCHNQINESNFQKSFINEVFNEIINFVFRPQYRSNEIVMQRTVELMNSLSYYPNNLNQIVDLMIVSNNYHFQKLATQICHRVNPIILMNDKYIETLLRKEINSDEPRITLISNIIKNSPTALTICKKDLINITLKNMLEKLKKHQNINSIDENDEDEIKLEDFVIQLLDVLPPPRDTAESFQPSGSIELSSNDLFDNTENKEQKISEFHFYRIPDFIYKKSPEFWNIFNEYRIEINQLFLDKYEKNVFNQSKKNYQNKKFESKLVTDYKECFSFDFRRALFNQSMINSQELCSKKFVFDANNILEDTFNQIGKVFSMKELKGPFYIEYKKNGEIEDGIDAGGLTKDWFTKFTQQVIDPSAKLFVQSETSQNFSPIRTSAATEKENLDKYRVTGIVIAKALMNQIQIPVSFNTSFLKILLHHEEKIKMKDLEEYDPQIYNSLQLYANYDFTDDDDIRFEYTNSDCETVELMEGGKEIKVTNDNKMDYIDEIFNYVLKYSVQKQSAAFCKGFESFIKHNDIRIFSPVELNILICGIPEINIDDLRQNVEFIHPFNAETKVVKLFFKAISKWDNEKLAKLLYFITAIIRLPVDGFAYFKKIGNPITIAPGGDSSKFPCAHTCVNRLDLPEYENEEQLVSKFITAIECNNFDLK